MKSKNTAVFIGILVMLVASSSFNFNYTTDAIDPYFTLVAKTNGGGVRPDFLNLLKQQLERIGINLEVIILDWPTFVGELLSYRDFDICYVGLSGGGADPDMTGIYDENGSLNLFGYHTSMDWNDELGTGINEWYMKEGTQIMPPNSEERIQHYWNWEQYLMDELCPLVPTLTPKAYVTTWGNLQGYNFSDGIIQSWGKMSWDGSHPGQISTNEFVISDAAWSDLNPFFQDDQSSRFISDAILDKLIWYDSDLTVWPHLGSVEYLNDTTIEITTREGIYWDDDPDGLFPDEEFNIEDVFFTLYVWRNLSSDAYLTEWMDGFEIIDDTHMLIHIDGDPTTPEKDPYAPSLAFLSRNILPEHYLNQTQAGYYNRLPDITHPSWNTFATQAFGTGLFELTQFDEGEKTILTMRDDCWWLDDSITSDPELEWDRRFGEFINPIEQLRIKIITEPQLAISQFKSGILDLVGVTDFRDQRLTFEQDPNFNVQSESIFSFSFFGYNMREVRPQMGDRTPSEIDPTMTKGLAMRKAISYAMDREEMNDIIYAGEYEISHWPIYPRMGVWCNPNIIKYEHDLDKAIEYFMKAGYICDYYPTAPGFTLSIVISTLVSLSIGTLVFTRKKVLKNKL